MRETLANKYRPKEFKDVTEQVNIITILQNQIATNSIKSSYLFCGSAGTGKTTLARIFANEINEHQGYPIEIDGASNNGVDNVRDIIKQAQTQSISSKYKVFIIDECHSISSTGWQAFLKLIEEPPQNTVFIFCTTEVQKIPKTILSRVQRFDFKRISHDGIIKRLEWIIQHQLINEYQVQSLEYIAKVADGGMRDAITMLDKCLSYDPSLTLNKTVECLNLCDYEKMCSLTDCLIRGDARETLDCIEVIYADGVDLKQFCKQYQDFILDILKYILEGTLNLTKIPISYAHVIDKLKGAGMDKYLDILDMLNNLNNSIKWDNTPKYQIQAQFLLAIKKEV